MIKKSKLKKIIRTRETKVKDVEEFYGIKLKGVNSNMKLSTFLEKRGYKPFANVLKKM